MKLVKDKKMKGDGTVYPMIGGTESSPCLRKSFLRLIGFDRLTSCKIYL